jgi:hypothetical protein
MGDVEVLDTTRLATATVPEATELIIVEPPVAMFLTPYDTFVEVAIFYPIMKAR